MWNVEVTELLSDVARIRLPPGGGAGAGSFGSGRLVAPGLILTARHVVETEHGTPLPDDGWEVRLLGDCSSDHSSCKSPIAADVIWRGTADLDLALLSIRGPSNRAPRWSCFGQVTGTHLVSVRVAGFPEALWNMELEPEGYCFPAELHVTNPHAAYWLRVDPAHAPSIPKDWRGLSGAAVLAWVDGQPCLLGAIQDVPRGFTGLSLRAARLSAAWHLDNFRTLIHTAHGKVPAPELVTVEPPKSTIRPEALADLVQVFTRLVSSPEALSDIVRQLNPVDRPSSPNVQGRFVAQLIERLAHPERDTKRVRTLISTCIDLVVRTCEEAGDHANLRAFLDPDSELTPLRMLEELRRVRGLHISPARRAELGCAEAQLCILLLDFDAAHAAAVGAVDSCPDDLEAVRLAGFTSMRVSRFHDARQFYRSRLHAVMANRDYAAIDTADALIDLAGACDQMFLLEEAEALLERTIVVLESCDDPKAAACRSMALNNLGGTLLALDDPVRAKECLLEAVRLRQVGGEAPFNLAISLVNLAECERLLMDPYLALGHLERARQVIRKNYGDVERRLSLPPHLLLGKVQNGIGTLKTIEFESPDEGVEELKEALRVYDLNGLTTFNYDVMITTFNLGIAYQHACKYVEALHHIRRAAAACRAILSPDHPVRQAIEGDERDLNFVRQ
jgi:tetratricopeptide (TPR) repeat protein